jgi:hypothetical protein
MKIGYVVLYVKNPEASRAFWINTIGMIEKEKNQVGSFTIVKVGFAEQDFSFELVPLDLMNENPNELDLAAPSIAFYVPNLDEMRSHLISREVQVSEIAEHSGVKSFGFSDNEARWFAIIES